MCFIVKKAGARPVQFKTWPDARNLFVKLIKAGANVNLIRSKKCVIR